MKQPTEHLARIGQGQDLSSKYTQSKTGCIFDAGKYTTLKNNPKTTNYVMITNTHDQICKEN